jgi:hypothetical protein
MVSTARSMIAPDFKLLANEDLLEAVSRLERTVADLAGAEGEIGMRVRNAYAEKLDAARAELSRRAA